MQLTEVVRHGGGKKLYLSAAVALTAVVAAGVLLTKWSGERVWLPRGNYILRVNQNTRDYHIPVPLSGYRCGPDANGAFGVTLRPPPSSSPPRLLSGLPEFVYIHSGNFLFGNRLNPREPNYLWLTGYFITPLRWLYTLPTEAEWEKAARGPENFDYGTARALHFWAFPIAMLFSLSIVRKKLAPESLPSCCRKTSTLKVENPTCAFCHSCENFHSWPGPPTVSL